MGRTNWLAIIACVVAAMGIGFLWYGALFNEQWMAGNGITMEGDNMFKNGIPRPYSNSPMIINTIVMLIYALIMNWLIHKTRDTSVVKGFLLGLVIGGILALNHWTANLFAGNPESLTMVDGSYAIVLFGIMGAILGGWRKK